MGKSFYPNGESPSTVNGYILTKHSVCTWITNNKHL